MSKKQLPLVICFVVLMVVAVWYFLTNSNSTFKTTDTNFAVPDTSLINVVQIINKADTLVLSKEKGYWKFNNGYVARRKAVNQLLNAIMGFNIKMPVSKSNVDNIIQGFDNQRIAVKVFSQSKKIRDYRLLTDSIDLSSVFIMASGSDKPFIAEVPGFNGNIVSLFKTEEHYWRDKKIISYNPDEILLISVEQPAKPAQSFRVLNFGKGRFAVKPIKSDKAIEGVVPSNLEMYLLNFSNLGIETFLKSSEKVLDEIKANEPDYILTVNDVFGNSTEIKVIPIKLKNKPNNNGEQYDLNHFYLLLNNKELALAKYVTFDPVLKDVTFFTSK